MYEVIQPWICPICRIEVATAFCASCGEKPLRPRDLTLRSLASQAFTALTSVDSRVVRSCRCLLLQPGSLTLAFLEGRRKPFIAALPLFLLANVLFFAVQSVSPEKVFSSPLGSHLHQQDWEALAQRLVAQKLAATGSSIEAYAPIFDRAVALNAKSLVILMVVPLLFFLPLLFRGAGRPFAAHVVFALHSLAFQLVLLCALLLIMAAGSWIGAEHAFASQFADHSLFGIYLAGCAVYFYLSTRTVFGSSGVLGALKTATLTLTAGTAVVGYRFALFLITLYST
jgi:hypothetical protein